jgi:nudix-type nucleoside diphosphatase (YffH/AdpP family)
MPEIVSEETLLDGVMVVEKATIKDGSETFERLRLLRQDASAVLLYDPEKDKVILTKQFRYPVAKSSPEDILEIVAGKVDSGELPQATAIREVEEETGYDVSSGNLRFLTSCFSSPGYSTERFFLFVASVTAKDRTSQGGGLATEHEKIGLIELDRELFLQQIKNGTIQDAKTCLAGMLWSCEEGQTPADFSDLRRELL